MGKDEKIGEVTLRYDHYSGEDLYCDGAIEDELLDIVKNHTENDFQKIIEQKKSWPVLYHLSSLRGNIVEWIPMNHSEKVLEVGSGCGAITGTLAQKAASVTSVDLSKKRSLINAYRNQKCSNVEINIGNFKDIEPDLPDDYDFIFLIGVFEYGQGYIGGEHPYEDFLKMLRKHLSPSGRIVIAIENRLGMKYFAGCREDHLGGFFTGIEGYPAGSVAKTFSRKALMQIFAKCGINEYSFYYPYPDYKFTEMIHSDRYLPGFGELLDNVRNYDSSRMLLFNEKYAYDEMVHDGMYQDFANSFEIIIGKEFPIAYSKFSNDRDQSFRIRTDIEIDGNGKRFISKYPLDSSAADHIQAIYDEYNGLCERYSGGELEINECRICSDTGAAEFPFVEGTLLSTLLDRCLEKGDMDGFDSLFDEYYRRISFNENYPVTDYDLIFSNILVRDDVWTVIDYEWTYGKSIPSREIAFRALFCYAQEDEKRRTILNINRYYEKLGLSEADVESLLKEEKDFQKYVTGNRKSMVELWQLLGKSAVVPESIIRDDITVRFKDRVQVYRDHGQDFSEDSSEFPDCIYDKNGMASLDIRIDRGCTRMRFDPAMSTCIVKFFSLLCNGETILQEKAAIKDNSSEVSGTVKLKPNGVWLSDDSLVFDSEDPWIEFLFPEPVEGVIHVQWQMTIIPQATAEDLAQFQRNDQEEATPEKKKLFWHKKR